MQNLTTYSCSPTPISYRGDEISHVSCSFRDLTRDRQTDRWQTDAVTKTEGSHTKSASLIRSGSPVPYWQQRTANTELVWQPYILPEFVKLQEVYRKEWLLRTLKNNLLSWLLIAVWWWVGKYIVSIIWQRSWMKTWSQCQLLQQNCFLWNSAIV